MQTSHVSINHSFVAELGNAINLGRERRVATASEAHFIIVKERLLLGFYVEGVLLSDEFLLVPGLSEEAVIGAATMQQWRIKLDFEHDTVHVDPKVAKMQLI